ncbi:MAG: D-alanyl-D-alanine carboxypeptidase [Desulfobulbaceae bacterium]|nr:D-alanyl-D-alanine carboxypeptidase [Desulfobulbaceae bacterium]
MVLSNFLPILLLCLTISWPAGAPLHAAQLPVLKVTAKQLPQQAVIHVPVDRELSGRITLGTPRDISAVKLWVGKSSSRANKLPNIHRSISSKSVMIMDAKTGETIFAKAPDNTRQPASTIKVLTGMIAIKSLEDADPVQVSPKASRMPRSKIYLDTKKTYKADDLINAVLLASANDASVALAEKIAGSEKNFANMMTLRAKLWGAKNTICRTASGLTAKGQQSTARDLATIFRHAMQEDEFARRMHKRKINTSYGQTLYNHNKALWRIKGAEAGKTGYTAAARQTYVGQFTRGEESIVVAIMGSETMWTDVKRLVDYGFKRKKQIQLAMAETGKQENIARINESVDL